MCLSLGEAMNEQKVPTFPVGLCNLIQNSQRYQIQHRGRPFHQVPLQVFTGKSVSPLIAYCIVSGLAHFPEPGTHSFNEPDTKLVT